MTGPTNIIFILMNILLCNNGRANGHKIHSMKNPIRKVGKVSADRPFPGVEHFQRGDRENELVATTVFVRNIYLIGAEVVGP